jgi:hypothetical protein
MTSRVVIRCVLFPTDELLGVEQLTVRAGTHFVHHRRLEVNEHRAWHMLPGPRLREERVERVIFHADGLVRRHRAVGLNAVLEAEQLPARVADLNAGLTKVNADHFAHVCCGE